MSDTKQAEKDYLRRAASQQWEMCKPFSTPTGAVRFEDAADLIHDFAVMLRMLAPQPGDLVLDLGSGGCWVSEWLARIDVCPVAVDIAFDMLHLGRARLPEVKAEVVVSDMEALPFATDAFDHACCLSAIHHVPSIPTALKEIARVVRPGGRVAFLEPGEHHSSLPASQAAMRDFGVLEQDIHVADFMQQCLDAGFAHVEVLPIAYVVPEIALTRDQWQQWRLARTKRPPRALLKMWRAVLEMLDLGQQRVLFEEALTVQVSRTLGERTESHPIIVAHRTMPDGPPPPLRYGSTTEVFAAPRTARAGEAVTVRVRATNTGNARWRASLRRPMPSRVGIHLLDATGMMLDRDFARASLPHDILPGGQCEVAVQCCAPSRGSYRLKVDMVTEGITWFEEKGSPTVTIPLDVT